MKYRILKWFIPVIGYFVYIGLFFLCSEIDEWLFGHLHDKTVGGPIIPFPDDIILYSALSTLLIPWGYILLVIAQRLYKKSRKWFNRFAWILTAASVMLVWVIEACNMSNIAESFLYSFWSSFPSLLFFYVPLFLMLLLCIQKRD